VVKVVVELVEVEVVLTTTKPQPLVQQTLVVVVVETEHMMAVLAVQEQ
jgi:hypothetical protein